MSASTRTGTWTDAVVGELLFKEVELIDLVHDLISTPAKFVRVNSNAMGPE